MATVLSLHGAQTSFELRDDASAVIADRSTGRQWTMGPVVHQEDNPIDVGHVWLRTGRSLCEQYPGRFRVVKEGDHLRVSVIGQLGETIGTFACSFKLDGPWLVFTLMEIDESLPDVWPPEAAFGSMNDYLKVTARQGAVLGGLHDNYGDMYGHTPSFPRGTLRRPDGSPKRGGYWAGGQCYLLNPRAGLEYARRNWKSISTLGIAKIYSDTITAMYLEESFEPGNTLTRSQDLHHKQELLAFFKSQGLIVASEEGVDFAVPWLDTMPC